MKTPPRDKAVNDSNDGSDRRHPEFYVMTRRGLLRAGVLVAASGTILLALPGCGGPTGAPAAGSSSAPGSTAASTTASISPAASSGAPKTTKPGEKIRIWFSDTFNKKTDQAIIDTYKEWGQANGIEAEAIVIPTSQMEPKVAAAVEAGTPPNIIHTNAAYWHSKDQVEDVSDIWNKIKDLEGGLYDVCRTWVTFDGKQWGIPFAINTWPIVGRKDIIEKFAGGKMPATWDEFNEMSARAQKPPLTYSWGICLGRVTDSHYNIARFIMTYGGHVVDKDGRTVTFKSEGTVKAFQMLETQFKKFKIIPPDSLGAPDNAWNNQAYQKKRVFFVDNPSSIWGWLVVNDPELAKNTDHYQSPAGPAGSVTLVDNWAFSVFKKAGNVDKAKEALLYFSQPEQQKKINVAVEGRWWPIYRNFGKLPMWDKMPEFKHFGDWIETARIFSDQGPPTPAAYEVINTFVLPDAVLKMLSEGKSAEEAVDWGDRKIKEIYARYYK